MSSPNDTPLEIDVTAWLKKDRLEKKLDRAQTTLIDIVFGSEIKSEEPKAAPSSFQNFETLLSSLVVEQLKKPEDLLKLNPSRREGLGRFLAELARQPEPADPKESLKQFTRFDRTEAEYEALKQLFKQISLVQIAKALLIKSWRATANTSIAKADLKDLTGAIEKELRPFIHLTTSTCQLIQQNFYSWSKLSAESQEQLKELLESIEDIDQAKQWLFERARCLSAETLGERERYSKIFYQSLWKSIEKNKLFQPRGEKLMGFSPTLRDGSLMAHSPSSIEWIGFEPLSFELLFCEIRFLWKEPKNPPLWLKGCGLEMSMEQQSSLVLTHCGKQNTLKQMDAVSCCEVALIAEETPIRTQGRSLAATSLRKLVDEHSILKKLKQPATTRGTYQACQALEKLRQGGTLIWAREELLTEASGKPSLQFILNQAKILLIADLSYLQATNDLKQDIPKALYLLKKENNLEERKSHRPLLIKAYGSVSQPSDIGILFDRVMSLVQKPDQVFPPEPFQLQARVSPMDQREWEQHWFNPKDDELVEQIESLKRNSTPLGQLAAIRTLHPSMSSNFSKAAEPSLFSESDLVQEKGFYAWVESSKNGNEIFTSSSDQLPAYMKNSHSVFWIVPTRPEWIAPFQALVRSQLTRDWFSYSVETKKGAWLVKEGDLKSVPVPKPLSDALQGEPINVDALPAHDAKVLNYIGSEPGLALRAIENHPHLKAHSFIYASQVLEQLSATQGTLFSLVNPEEEIDYLRFFDSVLTEKDMAPIHQHPLIRFTTTLSAHQSIQQITMLKYPTPGILLATSKGLTQTLFIQDLWLRERCFEMLTKVQESILEPTWGELTQKVRLPKNPEQAQMVGHQILKAFGSEKLRRKELNHLLSVCLTPRKENAEKVGMLQ